MNYIIHKSVRLLWLTGVRGVSSTRTNTNYSWLELVWQSKMLHCISVKHLWKTSATFRHCLATMYDMYDVHGFWCLLQWKFIFMFASKSHSRLVINPITSLCTRWHRLKHKLESSPITICGFYIKFLVIAVECNRRKMSLIRMFIC